MTRDDLIEVGEFMRRLEEDNTVRIVFQGLNSSIYGLTYKGFNDKYLMIINTNISYELQIETVWHEAKHVYSHIDKNGDFMLYEKEANKFAERCIKDNYLIDKIRAAW